MSETEIEINPETMKTKDYLKMKRKQAYEEAKRKAREERAEEKRQAAEEREAERIARDAELWQAMKKGSE